MQHHKNFDRLDPLNKSTPPRNRIQQRKLSLARLLFRCACHAIATRLDSLLASCSRLVSSPSTTINGRNPRRSPTTDIHRHLREPPAATPGRSRFPSRSRLVGVRAACPPRSMLQCQRVGISLLFPPPCQIKPWPSALSSMPGPRLPPVPRGHTNKAPQ